ncbi:hypothetical protein HPC62_15260 [Thermoleptolyngbya sichuanensis A183]|uniref:Uncharacterized protein n=1 Tax=Thermoleptolyngbya sichuanensis A183 TaxID=2737172 RepID=A0A6M8BBB7_9CYAN|nr:MULTISPECIES: hypothetical protein [Thermoleptolyngbya]QKD83372.1 hypothetical protein HPC62_15260 [Thermoleptolyngbya sichuanensis A183]
MPYPIARYLIRASHTRKLQLPSLILASLLSASPSLAATQVRGVTIPGESSPVLTANIFRRIRETVRDVTDTINTIDSSFPRSNRGDRSNPSPQAQPAPQPQSAPPSANSAPSAPPASRPAPASSDIQVVHRDNAPSRCQAQGNTLLRCEAFQIARVHSEGALVFSYYFNGSPFSFVTDAASEFRLDHASSYRVVGLMYGGETREIRGSCGVTLIGGQYRGAICQAENGIEFTYLNRN